MARNTTLPNGKVSSKVHLDELARSLNVYERVDVSEFQRRARVLQALWRQARHIPPGEHSGRPLGSRLPMPEAREQLLNFLTDTIREVVAAEVLDPKRSAGKLYGKPRIFNDLLSSQPLCFNLFGELRRDLPLASEVVADLTGGRMTKVTAIEFEESPGRGDPRYLNDRSAFDVFLRCLDERGARCFLGIEVKYHENLRGAASLHKPRYDEVAEMMGCFPEDRRSLHASPLQQVWRDHLLAGVVRMQDGFTDGLFVTLYPRDNGHVSEALTAYAGQLTGQDSFACWTLEDFTSSLRRFTDAAWVSQFEDRYLAFEKIDAVVSPVRVGSEGERSTMPEHG